MNPLTEITSKSMRLAMLYQALNGAEAATNLQDAWDLVDRVLRRIEDGATTLAYDRPANYGLGERMYIPPLHIDAWQTRGAWHVTHLFGHTLALSDTGDIQISRRATQQIELSKPGRGGAASLMG